MNESYPSHRVPQQNPMKHCPSDRVALMHPMRQGRVNGVSKGSLEDEKIVVSTAIRILYLDEFPTFISKFIESIG